MKKMICGLLLAAVLCAALAFAAAETGPDDFAGRWQDPAYDRALLKIMRTYEVDVPADEIWYNIWLSWPESAEAETVWYMSAKYDGETQSLTYTDGVKANVTYAADGSIASEEKVWDDAEGALIPIDGKLQWADRREDQLRAEAGEPNMMFERIPPTAPTAEAFLSDYFQTVANVEDGTAGASLKQAIAARDVVRFALRGNFWDIDLDTAKRSMLEAWNGMGEADRDSFITNLTEIIAPLLVDAFGNYDEVAGTFDDAGVGADMAWLVENREAQQSMETLLACTMAMSDE